MKSFEYSVEIEAPPDKVWKVLTDVEKWAEWTSSIDQIESLDSGPLQIGARYRIRQPKLSTNIYQVMTLEPGKEFSWLARAMGLEILGEHRMEALSGSNKVKVRNTLSLKGFLAPLVGCFYSNLTRRYVEMEVHGLRRRCEEIKK